MTRRHLQSCLKGKYTPETKATHGDIPTDAPNAAVKNQTRVESSLVKESKILDSFCNSVSSVVVDYGSTENFSHATQYRNCYPVCDKPVKGYIMILNNTFENVEGHKERKGSEIDVANLKRLWDQIGECEVIDKCNLKAHEMEKEIHKFVTSKIKKDCGFVAFFVMSHGNCDNYIDDAIRRGEGYFLGNDGKKVMISDVLKMLGNNYKGTTLQGIPKLIFFQICRGEDLHQDFQALSTLVADGSSKTQERVTNYKASTGDVLQGYATQPGYAACRNETKGSWYINAIVNVFSQHAKEEHVLDLLTRVNDAVSYKIGQSQEGKPCMQISEAITSLRSSLYFFPRPKY